MNEKVKKFFEKFWFIVWKDDSPKGWLMSLIFLFVVIKFIFFPLLSFATGTSLPLAIVESCSMYHDGNFFSDYNEWWQIQSSKYSVFEINKTEFSDFIFRKGFNKGDILFIVGAKPEKLKIGDVIIFQAGQRNPIIHRIVNITQENGKFYFSTIGDNNAGQLGVEKKISQEQLIGKAGFKLMPYAGWVKLIFFESFKPEGERGFCN